LVTVCWRLSPHFQASASKCGDKRQQTVTN